MRALSILARWAAALGLGLALTAVPVQRLVACSCAAMTPAEAARVAQIAFTGTVTSVAERLPGDQLLGVPTVLYDFAVDGVAKGDVFETVSLWVGRDDGMCGIGFGMGERWLIFASVEADGLTTHLCAGNVPLGLAEEPPIPVVAPGSDPSSPQGAGIPLGVIVPATVILGVAVLASVLFWRAERRPQR